MLAVLKTRCGCQRVMHIDSQLMVIKVPLQTVIDCATIDFANGSAIKAEAPSYAIREFELQNRDGDVAHYLEIA